MWIYTSEGSNHTKVENKEGILVITIPRKNRINKYTAKGIIDKFKEYGCEKL